MVGPQQETRTLGAERDRLDARLADVVDSLADADGDAAGMLEREARDVDQAGRAVAALAEEYGDDATVTVRGLDAVQYAAVENKTEEARENTTTDAGVPGSGRLAYAAHGLVDAPWFADDVGADDLDAKIAAFEGLPPGARLWVEELVDELGAIDEGNWPSLRERIADGSTTDSADNSTSTPQSDS